jgi:hypothetical protein
VRYCLLLLLLIPSDLIPAQDNIQKLLFNLRFAEASEMTAHNPVRPAYEKPLPYQKNYLLFLRSLTGGDDHSYQYYMLQSEKYAREIKALAGNGPEQRHCLCLISIESAILNLDHN